jgi:hypothetical protein
MNGSPGRGFVQVLMEDQMWSPNAMGLEEALIGRIPTCTFAAEPDEYTRLYKHGLLRVLE